MVGTSIYPKCWCSLGYKTDRFPCSVCFSGTGRNVTRQQFHAYRLHDRSNRDNFLLKTELLFQEYLCLSFASVENMRLNYARFNQKTLRCDLYANLEDAVRKSDGNLRAGKRVICPKSIFNSYRNRFSRSNFLVNSNFAPPFILFFFRYQDAIAVCRKFHQPDFFITFTCNPLWKEIQENLKPGQTATSRPDLVVRVFRLKLQRLLDDIRYHGKCRILSVPMNHYIILIRCFGALCCLYLCCGISETRITSCSHTCHFIRVRPTQIGR